MEPILPGWLSVEELILYRMESFHRGRAQAIQEGDTPFEMKPGAKLVVHLIPSESMRGRKRFSASDLRTHGQHVLPLGDTCAYRQFNAYGYVIADGRGEVRAYSQLFRDGRMESLTAEAVYLHKNVPVLRDDLCEQAIIQLTNDYIRFGKGIGLSSPVWIFAALIDGVGVRLKTAFDYSEVAIRRPSLFLPELEICSLDIDPGTVLKPLFDDLSNAVGRERSQNYDDQGNRRERNRQ